MPSCDVDCPVQKTAQILDGKWTTLIIRDLLPGKRRYSELLKSLPGISPRVLAARLRFLEENRIITKTIYPVIPPKTEYQLTALGKGLTNVITAMGKFGGKLA
ncbi:MAG: helix-turn-helix transcriptional regulator [Betaproteobacteria bacterium]|nr:helix-turn-helix transcriptional regulator [Betaproteobacteria bacterium]